MILLDLAMSLNFVLFLLFIYRVGNKVAHVITHLQVYVSGFRVWLEDGPDCVFDLAPTNLHHHLNRDG